MSFSSARARMIDAIFERLGEDATWEGIADPVRVITRDEDRQFDVPARAILAAAVFFRVRKSEVPAPAIGDVVTLAEGDAEYRIIADPRLDRRGVWRCEMEAT